MASTASEEVRPRLGTEACNVRGEGEVPGTPDAISAAYSLFMPRSRRSKLPPVPTWTCSHCGHVHRPADLLRLDGDNLQCKGCGQSFESIPDDMRKRKRKGFWWFLNRQQMKKPSAQV